VPRFLQILFRTRANLGEGLAAFDHVRRRADMESWSSIGASFSSQTPSVTMSLPAGRDVAIDRHRSVALVPPVSRTPWHPAVVDRKPFTPADFAFAVSSDRSYFRPSFADSGELPDMSCSNSLSSVRGFDALRGLAASRFSISALHCAIISATDLRSALTSRFFRS